MALLIYQISDRLRVVTFTKKEAKEFLEWIRLQEEPKKASVKKAILSIKWAAGSGQI